MSSLMMCFLALAWFSQHYGSPTTATRIALITASLWALQYDLRVMGY